MRALAAAQRPLLALFVATLFLGAVLLFSIQPLFAKMALPLLGGAPGVWNAAMVFFQATLLAGYAYAHGLSRLLPPRRQALVHLTVMAVAFATLPVALAAGWRPPAEANPIPWLIGLMTVSVGLPFFAVSTTAPLLQRWFAGTGHAAAGDPYFLYAASNLGSILALLGYPILAEPLFGLERQGWLWTAGYAALVVAVAACAWVSTRAPTALAAVESTPGDGVDIGWRRRLHWLVLSFAPAALLLGVTAHISADVAAAPLLWVVPLTLYLLTFVLVFARRPPLRHAWMVKLQPFVVLPLVLLFKWSLPIGFLFALHLGAFFVTAMVCHGELAKRRPPVSHLTEFYLWMSLGGVLGGAFVAIVAPLVFDTVLEYPLALTLACLLRPRLDHGPAWRWLDLALPAALFAFALPTAGSGLDIARFGLAGVIAIFVVIGLALYSFRLRPLRFGLGVGALLAVTVLGAGETDVLAHERSFFGVYRVRSAEDGQFNLLVNGTTVHGAQRVAPTRSLEPLGYYHRATPLGQLFTADAKEGRLKRIALIGLGIGTTTCYRQAGRRWTIYEIDPVIATLARDRRYFTYLTDCAPDAPILFGDARLTLARAADGAYDLMVIDAFTSDAIPIYLLTREALALYLAKLADDGILMFHISNRNLDLAPVLAALAHDAGIAGLRQTAETPDGGRHDYRFDSTWVAMARRPERLADLAADGRWTALAPEPGRRPWTDDYSNLWSVLKW